MLKAPNYRIFCLIGIIIAFNVAAISAIIPGVAETMGKSEFASGSIIWAYMIPYGICALFYGPLSRRFQIKSILLACLGLFSLFSFLSSTAKSLEILFVFRFFTGVFAAAMTPLTLICIAHTFKLNERGKAVGTFFSITFISSLSGLFLSGIISWRLIFLIPAIIAAVTFALVFLFFKNTGIASDGPVSRYIQALKTPKIVRVFCYIFLVSLLYHLARQWMGVYLHIEHALSKFTISMLLTTVSFAGIFGEFFGGLTADKKGRVFTLSIGAFFMSISIIMLPNAEKIIPLAIIMFTWGLGWTINHSGLSTYLTDMPKPYLQEVSSLNSSVRFLAGGLGAALGTILMQKSFSLTFIAIRIILLLLSLSSKLMLNHNT